MRFKVHTVKELYPDLNKYCDNREEGNIGMFNNVHSTTTIEWVMMSDALRPFGYNGAAELYNMNPAAGGNELSIGYGLIKILGQQEEVNEMVLAHGGTKICHLYIVGPEEVSIGFYSQIFPLIQPITCQQLNAGHDVQGTTRFSVKCNTEKVLQKTQKW
jgi:hypothetical protein